MEHIAEEVWKNINEKYQISSYGNVRKINKTNEYDKRTPKYLYLKTYISKYGYQRVFLTINNKVKGFAVHRLVAQAFISNPDNLPQINHKDENKLNNHVDNLEWCSVAYNNSYGTHSLRVAKSNWKKIVQYDLKGNFIKKWNSIKEAGETLNICKSSISLCLVNKYKSAGGFIWEYDYD